ncbi:MAG: mechanosensitive ion channel [Zhengella sp.]|uniref:mechanosensitive ion channel family protein n=1 Tax=Zhengella sp. TaxID=2282762 RepID=UPI001D81F9E2|nr:mechanosensitive ion channel [Notoacmeibacter sp.]MCC0028244.1 mechanosensitive ion channel [Brucellaceae bacterium]
MSESVAELLAAVAQNIEDLIASIDPLWTGIQLAIAAWVFLVAWLVSLRVEPALEERARRIRGNPGLLRMVVALLRRSEWVIFILAMAITLSVMRAVTWPSRSWLISLILSLATLWLVIAVVSRVIRNRMFARLVAYAGWIWAAIIVLGVSDQVQVLLDSLALSVGQARISLWFTLQALFAMGVTLWLATGVGNFIDRRLQRSDDLTPSLRVLLGKVIKIALVLLAGAVALSSLGIDLTALTVFSGAVGVGLGFGLQKVVSNFISGIIILLDRSIKPGDTISLDETFGWIRELRARFVSVVTRDGKEFLIPNEEFITNRVVNWSFSDQLVRLDVEFGVSYSADPHEVSRLAIEACKAAAPRVQSHPSPVCWLIGFGDSSLDFVLRFWIADPQAGLTNVRGAVMIALWDTFKANGVGIPFPHREVIMRTPVEVTTAGEQTGKRPAQRRRAGKDQA